MIDQFHLSFFVPGNLADPEAAEIRQVLDGAMFRRQLLRAIRVVVRQHDVLQKTRVTVTR
jgi:hypothetical protein